MNSTSIDLDSNELCLIDCGITSLVDVPLKPQLKLVNLHSNYISRIDCLQQLKCLKHLDLSANQIRTIEGLDGLVLLKTLNLSCNLLTAVQGLTSLRCLEKLNLSFNQIDNLTGFKSLAGSQNKLTFIDLHGNKLSSVAHIAQCLCRLGNLTKLVLSLDGSSNPVCHKPGYETEVLSNLPQLTYLDGQDRHGNAMTDSESNIPGLDEYLEYLLSSGGETEASKESSMANLITPKIDKAMEMFKYRQQHQQQQHQQQQHQQQHHQQQQRHDQSSSSISDGSYIPSVTDTESSPSTSRVQSRLKTGARVKHTETEDQRLVLLEQQIAQLLTKAKKGPTSTTSGSDVGERSSSPGPGTSWRPAERDVTNEDESGEDEGATVQKRREKKSRLPSYCKSTQASRAKKDVQISHQDEEGANIKRPKSPSVRTRTPTARAASDDEKIRNDIQSSYTEIMQELERERERRWKAEAAAKKLIDHIQGLTSKAKDDSDMKDLAIDATSRLKQSVMNEREVKLRLQQEVETLKTNLQEAVEHLSKSRAVQDEQTQTIREMEELRNKEQRERLQQQTHDHKKFQEAQMRAAALGREVDMLRASCESQKVQVQSLQSLLANREQEHRDEMKTRYNLGSKEMQEALQSEVEKAQREQTLLMKQQQERIEEMSKQYTDLEEEFRQALKIESSRFHQLKEAFETISEENSSNKAALLSAHNKDDKSSQMLSELTALVKEQKGRIAELTKSKQEQVSQYRERVSVLEAHVEEARKRMVQFELLKQESVKLKSTIHGQESVIEGLRAERKLWDQELALQGASLAQDRGTLDAKLEAQKSEINMLKKQLERETDGLKIKTKMLEDQTETIKKLKEGVEERDDEIKKCRQDSLKLQQSLEGQLAEERTTSQDTHEMLERLRERKQDLKQQVADLQSELDESKRAHSILNSRWKEKSQLIGQLESQVQDMKESWEKKEVKLAQERDKALQAANLAIERLKSADDAFRQQLEDKVTSFQERINQLETEKQMEVDQANLRVHQVEEEMRELLKENQTAKKAMEDKVKRLTRALSEIESDLY